VTSGAVASGAAIVLRGVSHVYHGPPPVEALRGIDLDVTAGAFVAIVGPSGCGKSTLLRVLAGLTAPSEGSATVDGASAVHRPGLVAFQPQRDLLLPWRRVLANATLGAEVAGLTRDDARRGAEGLLDRFGLAGFEQAWPSTLSGGMRQRVALLRTFLVPRPALLLDEPLGALDAITRREMQGWLQSVWAADGRTVLLVTHDVEEALVLADRVLVMSPRPGRFVADYAVGLVRPRGVEALTQPEFVALKRELLAALGT
jgi:ABC-type nitrate/sulfonate/bicarbonate transport system ATPase subunit